MLKDKKNSHEFSLYWSDMSDALIEKGARFKIDNAYIYHRVARVLRIKRNETFVLFDQMSHMRVKLVALGRKNMVEVKHIKTCSNIEHTPTIIFFLPLLKREALEQAMYSSVELGANKIRLMKTQKTQRKWGGTKEFDRLHNIMISAAEQSKNYAFAQLHEPQSFSESIALFEDVLSDKFFFDPDGKDLFPIVQSFRAERPNNIFLMIGPEGDLTIEEKDALRERHVQFLRLTPTILRAQQAVTVSLGIFRSMFS